MVNISFATVNKIFTKPAVEIGCYAAGIVAAPFVGIGMLVEKVKFLHAIFCYTLLPIAIIVAIPVGLVAMVVASVIVRLCSLIRRCLS